jgi:acyl-CoA thioester hydrolase
MPTRGVSYPPPLPAALYQGSVNTWECDDGGHLNVRFQLERAMAGLAFLAGAMGMRTANAGAIFLPLDLHVRFLKEARPGAGLVMHGGVLDLEESGANICLDMRHSDGAPATAFRLQVAHVEPRDLKPFPLSSKTRAAAAKLMCALPEHASPRSVDVTRAPSDVKLARAKELGLARIGGHLVTPDQCDPFGRLRAEHVFGRVSDSIPNLISQWRQKLAKDAAKTGAPVEPAGAVVEARVVFRRWPRAGDLIEVHSGVAEVSAKTNRLVHWLVDPVSGAGWASVEAMALTFDIATRKAITPSPEALAAMTARVIPGLAV